MEQPQVKMYDLKEIQKNLEKLNQIKDVHCMKGNFNYDAYHFGLANGLILAQAIIENKEQAEYLQKPEEFINNTRDNNHLFLNNLSWFLDNNKHLDACNVSPSDEFVHQMSMFPYELTREQLVILGYIEKVIAERKAIKQNN